MTRCCQWLVGMTFVELMIVSTMFSVLFVGLGTHLRGGMVVWQRVTATTEQLTRARVALDRLERDLANSVIYYAQPESREDPGQLPVPQFTASTLAWCTVAQPKSPSQPATVRFVTYGCEPDGDPNSRWLLKTSQSVEEARAKFVPAPQLLLQGCSTLAFRYAYQPVEAGGPLQWLDTWTSTDTLPGLIDLSLTRPSGDPLRRICVIPIGKLGDQQREGE